MHCHETVDLSQLGRGAVQALLVAAMLVGSACLMEFVGGHAMRSVGLFSDAMHLATDFMAITAVLIASIVARANHKSRAETLAAAFNVTTLVVVAGYLGYQGYTRFVDPSTLRTEGMLIVALFCGLFDIMALRILAPYKEQLSIRSVYAHILSDVLSTAGVVLGALAMVVWGALWVDGLLAMAIASAVMRQALSLGRDVYRSFSAQRHLASES